MPDRDSYWKMIWGALGEAAAAQAGHHLASEPARRYVQLVSAALASGRAHVASPTGDAPQSAGWGWQLTEYGSRSSGQRIGWIEGGQVYLEPDAAFAVVKRLADETGEPIALQWRTDGARFAMREHLRKWEAGRDCRRASSHGAIPLTSYGELDS